MRKTILLLLALFSAPSAFATCNVDDFFFEPDPVYAYERNLEVVIRGTCADGNIPVARMVRFDGERTIVIDFQHFETALGVPTPWGERVRLPMLEAGTYTIELHWMFAKLAATTLVVRDRPFVVKPAFGNEFEEVQIEGVDVPECTSSPCPEIEVFFGNAKATDVHYDTRGELVATPPPGSGVVDVRVVRGAFSVTHDDAFRYGTPFEGDMERVLFPVNFYSLGAFGSEWLSDIAVRNDGPVTIDTRPHFFADPDSPVLPIPTPIPSGAKGNFLRRDRDGGEFLYTPRGLERNLSYASHVVDRSRSEVDLGTEVPVVRAKDAMPVIRLLEVPVDARYRAKLRVYDFDRNGVVRVTLRDPVGGRVIDRLVELTGYEVCPNAPCFSERPAFGAIDLDSIPELREMESGVDVTVTAQPSTADTRLWAFATVTNNDTQHVTLYTPQHRRRIP